MKNIFLYCLFYSTILVFLFSCSPQLYIPNTSDIKQQEELLKGRKIYIANCGACHNLVLPNKYNKNEWVKKLNEMQQRSKISDNDKNLILNYLTNHP